MTGWECAPFGVTWLGNAIMKRLWGRIGEELQGWTGRIEGGDGRNWGRNHRIK